MVTENNNFSSNAYHSFANDKVISKCKNDKSFFKIFRFSPFGGGNQNLLPTRFKKDGGGGGEGGGGGGGDYAKYEFLLFHEVCI